MATFTLKELQDKHNTSTVKSVFSMEDIQRNKRVAESVQGNQFEQKPTTFLGKARDFATSILGGGKLAEGAGMAGAATGVLKQQEDVDKQTSDIIFGLQKKIRENKANGLATDKLEGALQDLFGQSKINQDTTKDFVSALPSNAEVVGSAVRLGSTLVAPTIAGSAVKATALGKGITGVGSGLLRGAGAGAVGGAIEGLGQGIGTGIESQAGNLSDVNVGEVAKDAAIGGVLGGVTGGAVGGVLGGAKGAFAPEIDESKLLDYVTPSTSDLTPIQYKKALARGEITPKSNTSAATYNLPDSQREVAMKYKDVITKDPVQTRLNINDKIVSLDDEVGDFLRKNNGIFSKGELRNTLNSTLDDVQDLSVDQAAFKEAKSRLVDNFVKSIESNDMESLWMARKNFDSTIEKAFSGSYSAQKEMKIAFRNAVQDYISQRTGNGTYQSYMKDMTNLFRLGDSVSQKATKERALSAFGKWAKENPKLAKTIGWGGAGISAATAARLFGFGGSGDSSN